VNRAALVVLVLAATLAGVGAALVVTRSPEPPALEQATLFETPRPMTEFSLVDHEGRPFDLARLRGHWTFLFFGFVNCPDVCPTTLATLAAARKSLADLPAGEIPGVALVSVDPGRDTPPLLASYVAHFDPSFTGVTGSPAAIEALTRALGVAVIIGSPAEDGSYTVDHSAAIFLVDPEASVSALFGAPHDAATIARDYRRVVAAR
jgi:protein SCO1/2